MSGPVGQSAREVDTKALRRFLSEMNRRYVGVERDIAERVRADRTDRFDRAVPPRWRGRARLSELCGISPDVDRLAQAACEGTVPTCLYVRGARDGTKTAIGWAVAREWVRSGSVTPEGVLFVSERDLTALPQSGFEGAARLSKLLDAEAFIVDNMADRDRYEDREMRVVERLLDRVHDRSVPVVFTGTRSIRGVCDVLSDAAAARFSALVSTHVVETAPQGCADVGELLGPQVDRSLFGRLDDRANG